MPSLGTALHPANGAMRTLRAGTSGPLLTEDSNIGRMSLRHWELPFALNFRSCLGLIPPYHGGAPLQLCRYASGREPQSFQANRCL
jgi:hypothetical protein